MAAYRSGVLVGNWEEDLSLEEERLRDFMHKRERGELLIQKINKLQDNLFKKIQLSVSKDGFLHFGDTVMLLHPDNKSSVENRPGECGRLTLAINLDELSVYSAKSLQIPRGISAIESADPMGRNTFCILRRTDFQLLVGEETEEQGPDQQRKALPDVDESAEGEPIRFGQKFRLGTTGGFSGQMLYLASDHKSFIRFAKKSRLQQVFLTENLSYLTCWQATFLDPQLRLEHEGFPVPANSKMIITHCHTNRSLAVPRNFWTWSYFGKEYEVICHTYLDSHKVEEDKNYWIIVTGNPGDENGTMIDRPSPHPGGISKNEFHEET